MEQTNVMMPELLPEDRLQYMQTNCDKTEVRQYLKPLTPADLDIKRETLAKEMSTLFLLKRRLAEQTKLIKEQMKPLEKNQQVLLNEISSKLTEADGTLYLFADQEKGKMFSYDENGEEVESRRLRPEERQLSAFVTPMRKVAGDE